MGLDLRHIRRAVRLELDPRRALEHVDIVMREDGTCAMISFTVPGWHPPREGQSAEDARTVVTEFPYHNGSAAWEQLVTSRTDHEREQLLGRWEWMVTPTDQQRAASWQEYDRTA